MAVFRYKGRDKDSHKPITGTLQAANQQDAIKQLRAKGVLVLSVAPDHSVHLSLPFINQVKNVDRILFTRELAVMIKAGLPILQALRALKDQTGNKTLVKTVDGLIRSVEGGTSLSDAFAQHPNVFPPIFISVSRIGEKAGKLEEVLTRLANQLEKDEDLVSKVKSAMIYPSFILAALVGVMVLIMIYIIPQLKVVFEDSGVELPALTKGMLALSGFMQAYFLYIAITVVVLVIIMKIAAKKPSVRAFLERIRFYLPVFGKLYKQVLMTRFTNTMSTLLAAGLPMMEAIKTTGEVMDSPTYTSSLQVIVKEIENGGSLSKALLADKRYPPMVGHMVAIGEDSGGIDTVLETVGGFFDKEVDATTRNLSASLEPILMLAMGLGVGLVVSSVIMPMYGLVNAV